MSYTYSTHNVPTIYQLATGASINSKGKKFIPGNPSKPVMSLDAFMFHNTGKGKKGIYKLMKESL